MKNFIKKHNKVVFFATLVILSLTLGIIGLMQEGENFFDALYMTICNFSGEFEGTANGNILLYISKFIAICFALSLFLSILSSTEVIADTIKTMFQDTVYVFGNNELVELFVKNSTCTIVKNDPFLLSKKIVLLGNDEENNIFYNENKDALINKEVYYRSTIFSNTTTNKGKHFYFSFEEQGARKYWIDNDMVDIGLNQEEVNIAILGEGQLVEELLHSGVNFNIFKEKQKVHYHVFGNNNDFKLSHINLDKLNIHIYDETWQENINLLNSVDRIIVCEDDKLMTNLFGLLKQGTIHYLTNNDLDEELITNHRMGGNKKIKFIVYNWLNCCSDAEIIRQDSILAAKQINYNYMKNNPPKDRSLDTVEGEWARLSTFHRFSNIASAEYYNYVANKLKDILMKQYPDDEKKVLQIIASLEHERWEHYHYFSNWTYGPVRDNDMKHHPDLIDFEELSQEEKAKDLNTMRTLE